MSVRTASAFAGALLSLASLSSAFAAPMLVYVSTRGTNAPGCGTLASPCRQLQAAQDAVAPGGYINILDPGEYDPVQFLKSINVVNESNGAAVFRAGTSPPAALAIGIGGNANDVVRLRGLTIEGRGGSTIGIGVRYYGRLELVDCVLRNAGQGVYFNGIFDEKPTFAILNTTITSNASGLSGDVRTGFAKGLKMTNNTYYGMDLRSFSTSPGPTLPVVVEDSLIANDPGLSTAQATGFDQRLSFAVLKNTVIRGFPYGVASTSSIVRLTGSTITGNATAMLRGNSSLPYLESSGDNVIRGNADDALGALSPGALH